jgi:hypothetical protein
MGKSPQDPRYRKRPNGKTERCYTTAEVFKRLLSLTKDPVEQGKLKKQIKTLEEHDRYGEH